MQEQLLTPCRQTSQDHERALGKADTPVEQTGFTDMRTSSLTQRKLASAMSSSPRVVAQLAIHAAIDGSNRMQLQRRQADQLAPRPNRTGLPDRLKSGIESLSGLSMDHVDVHYNSAQPAQLGALAYARGNEIHVGPGQEKHLPHEAWHVVQQAQGRVKPTLQMKGGVRVNDDSGLEHEADVMGAKADASGDSSAPLARPATGVSSHVPTVQRLVAPPAAPPLNGVRAHTLNGDGVPTESHVTTPVAGNDLVGTVPGTANINGWPFIQGVGATGTWVRFHLVNQQLGGLGNQGNLVPASQATNHNTNWRTFETSCQTAVAAPRAVHISVDVGYHAPHPNPNAGTRDANLHFYPTTIAAACHRWNAGTGAWQQHATVAIAPFPLLPPPVPGETDLTQVSNNWLRTTLMGSAISTGQAATLASALAGAFAGEGEDIPQLRMESNESTDGMQLLDAIEGFTDVQFGVNRLPDESRENIANEAYVLP
jgi:hypothetical protein